MKQLLLPILLCTFIFSACQKDIAPDLSIPVGSPKLPASPVSGSIAGIVVDQNNNPVANAQVYVSNSVYVTDDKGAFKTIVHNLDKYISTVKVSLPGYFTTYRSFSAKPTVNYVAIKLLPKILTGTFSTNSQGNITLPDGSNILFQPNSINTKASGTAYSGTVNVYATYMDPTVSDFGASVPGSFMGEDATQFYALKSTGMIAVELESPAGTSLQLAADRPAIMKMTIAPSLLSKAPSKINTWNLDDRGIWKSEGTGVRNGNKYEFQVNHFSFWTWAIPVPTVFLSMNIKDQHGYDLVSGAVSLTSSTLFGTTYGAVDINGNVSGMVPANETLELQVASNLYSCYFTPIHTQNIGPLTSNTSLNIIVQLTIQNLYTLSGTVTNCLGLPVQNGTVAMYTNYYYLFVPIINGNYSMTVYSCTPLTSVYLIAIDNTTQQQSAPASIPVSGNAINLGNISACGVAANEFMNYTLDGTNYSINTTNASTMGSYSSGNVTYFSAATASNVHNLGFYINGTTAGTHPVLNDTIHFNYNQYGIVSHPQAITNITIYGAVGEFIEGNFNIPFTQNNIPNTLTGNFRLRRIY